MDEDVIENLSLEDLSCYASSIDIVNVTTYTETDAEGNTTIIPKERAISGAASTNSIVLPPEIGGGISYTKSETTTVMEISFTVFHYSEYTYKYVVDQTLVIGA